MKLKWLELANFGPFAVPSKLYLDPAVTVLTGANDTGKSSLLRAIQIGFGGVPMKAHEVNQDRADQFQGRWEDDPAVTLTVGVEVTEASLKMGAVTGTGRSGDELVLRRRLNQGSVLTLQSHRRRDGEISPPAGIAGLPTAHLIGDAPAIRDIIPLRSMSEPELQLLRIGFGDGFGADQQMAIPRNQRNTRIGRAQDTLNRRLTEVFPAGIPIEFRLQELGEKGDELNVSLVDRLNCFAPVSSRGAGIRKLLGLMALLLTRDADIVPFRLILVDEPENSLHADAQHALRRLLERMGSRPNAQVIYATHSSGMINTMRPGVLRVLERREVNGRPTTVIENQAFNENFYRVRSSLGITPADSLLFSPVTVVVEGPTEVRCLPLLMEKLRAAGTDGFEDANDVLAEAHFLDGTGDSYEYMTRIAKSQNVKPIVFLDGDKEGAVAKLKELHPDVPVIQLDRDEEFENLVPRDIYIGAAAQVLERAAVTPVAFDRWVDARKPKANWLLSKRVERWLDEEFDKPLYKPLVMERAVGIVGVDQVKVAPLRRLLAQMRTSLMECA